MTDDYSFALRLRQLRERRGLNQIDLGNAMGINPNRISNWETGVNKSPSIDVLRKFCRVLGCTADELLGMTEIELNTDELWCLEHYRKLGAERRRAVRDLIDTLEGFRPADG
jgi:transcriptional regulator with XRE-family HTH domain